MSGLAQGAFAERIADGHQAARAALRVLEETERPAWLGTKIDLGPGVERLFPSQVSALVSGETLWVIGRLAGKEPERLKTSGPAGQSEVALKVETVDDRGDLSRRWAEARLAQMLEAGEGRAALVDLGMKNAIITPVTSFYVPTKNEMTASERAELAAKTEEAKRYAGARKRSESAEDGAIGQSQAALSDNKEGGFGTRAKGEEGSMGMLAKKSAPPPVATEAPAMASAAAAAPAPPPMEAAANNAPRFASPAAAQQDRQQALREATEFGIIGSLDTRTNDADAPALKDMEKAVDVPADKLSASGNMWGDELGDSFGAGGLGLSGIGIGGGGVLRAGSVAMNSNGPGGGLAAIGDSGRSSSTAASAPSKVSGFGSGHGRLGGAHQTSTPKLQAGALAVSGRLPPEVIARIVRQNFGRFRLCYEQGLARNPNLQGQVNVRFTVNREGAVSSVGDGGSRLPDPAVLSCVMSTFNGLAFPAPEGGIVTVTYPISFEPGGGGGPTTGKSPSPRIDLNIYIGDLSRKLLGCSAAAAAPFEERVRLWRERLSKGAGDPRAL
ncbi:MAG TPA: AgmX/PglI C-terminal domain-containing protein, partial [Polyangiaceae bacterium]|nr:AgmX/PglI C-terminal domain-containing protein [Polyangiaceae bacterium]